MPTLFPSGIVVTAAQANRIQNAIGVATVAEAEAWVIDCVKQAVRNNEQKQARDTEQANVDAALAALEAAVEAVQDIDI